MKWTTDEFTGRKFGKYEVLCRLAVGGMAEIFLGFARTGPFVGRPVVLKRILSEQREDPSALQMLIDEAKLTATLSHPNVAQVMDLEVHEEDVLLVIEFIAGANMEEVVEAYTQRNEPVPLGFALATVREAAQGLAHAHGHKNSKGEPVPIIHRDVTPRNVMVDFEGAIKMLDFGIARAKGSERRTQVGMVRGTTAYMSPEQAIGKELDPRTDIFSLGIIFHELLTGQRLFYKGNPAQEMAAVYEGEIPLPSKVNRRVPKTLDNVVMRALERKPEKRYQSALELIRDLSLAAGSTTWAKDRCAEMVRERFQARKNDIEKLVARIPRPPPASSGPAYPEGRTLITKGPRPNDFAEEEQPKTLINAGPLVDRRMLESMRGTVPADPGRSAEGGRPTVPTDPAREPVTDTRPATPNQPQQRLSAQELFDDVQQQDPGERTRIIPGPASVKNLGKVPLAEVPTDPRRGAVPRPTTASRVPLVIAAILALIFGAVGGAFIFKSMQQPTAGALGRVSISTDRAAEVFLSGQSLGKTPISAWVPAGTHSLTLKEDDGSVRVVTADVKPNDETKLVVVLDQLQKVP